MSRVHSSYVATLIILLVLGMWPQSIQAQTQEWQPSGNDIYYKYNDGNVGIGTWSPAGRLHIKAPDFKQHLVIDRTANSSVNHVYHLTPSFGDGYDHLRIVASLSGQSDTDIAVFRSDGNVGIGTTTPAYLLDVDGATRIKSSLWFKTDGTEFRIHEDSDTPGWVRLRPYLGHGFLFSNNGDVPTMAVGENGNVGIGTLGPVSRLHIKAPSFKQHLVIDRTADSNINHVYHLTPSYGEGYDHLRILAKATGEQDTSIAVFRSDGNVGIGTTNPSKKLDVAGTVRANEVVVVSPGADFVFDDRYKLPTLEEVAAHINQHGHLPEVPSAAEMQAEGVSLASFTTTLLQKIEELTLYAIEQQERADEQQAQNDTLRQHLAQLEARLKALEQH